MITLTRYMPVNGKSLKVEVSPSITRNTTNNHHNTSMEGKEIAIDVQYKNYNEGVLDRRVTLTLPLEDSVTWENIYEGEFQDYIEEYLDDIDVDHFARTTVIDAIARGYLRTKETNSVVDFGSCLLAMSVNVEVDEFDEEVQGITMDLDQDYNDDDSYNYNDNYNNGNDYNVRDDKVDEIRAFLVKCGVNLGIGLSSSGAHCAICLEEFVGSVGDGGSDGGGVEMTRLPCNHVFHGDCLVDMVIKGNVSPSCPLCRSELITGS